MTVSLSSIFGTLVASLFIRLIFSLSCRLFAAIYLSSVFSFLSPFPMQIPNIHLFLAVLCCLAFGAISSSLLFCLPLLGVIALPTFFISSRSLSRCLCRHFFLTLSSSPFLLRYFFIPILPSPFPHSFSWLPLVFITGSLVAIFVPLNPLPRSVTALFHRCVLHQFLFTVSTSNVFVSFYFLPCICLHINVTAFHHHLLYPVPCWTLSFPPCHCCHLYILVYSSLFFVPISF